MELNIQSHNNDCENNLMNYSLYIPRYSQKFCMNDWYQRDYLLKKEVMTIGAIDVVGWRVYEWLYLIIKYLYQPN